MHSIYIYVFLHASNSFSIGIVIGRNMSGSVQRSCMRAPNFKMVDSAQNIIFDYLTCRQRSRKEDFMSFLNQKVDSVLLYKKIKSLEKFFKKNYNCHMFAIIMSFLFLEWGYQWYNSICTSIRLEKSKKLNTSVQNDVAKIATQGVP